MNFMIIVIDGYNVLKPLHGQIVTSQERSSYINTLKKYTKKTGHMIILVFDGGPSYWQSCEKYENVTVIYSGMNQTADDAIVHYCQENKNNDLLLVTADRDLIDHVGALGIISTSPLVFSFYVQQALQKISVKVKIDQNKVKKLHPYEENNELDLLMRQASTLASSFMEYKSEENAHQHKKNCNKDFMLSKKERALMNKLKKL